MNKWYKKILHIYEPLYQANFYYIPANSYKEYARIIDKQLKIKSIFSDKTSGAGFEVYEKDNTDVGFIWAPKGKWDLISHECFHASHWLMANRGLKLTDDSEEAYAYLLQFIVGQIKDSK